MNKAMTKEAEQLFSDNSEILLALRNGDSKALDMVFNKISFTIDEDDIIRAFRNKKEQNLLDCAKRAKAIRDFYQKLFLLIEKRNDVVAERNNYLDCI
jgi:hypothetical protein